MVEPAWWQPWRYLAWWRSPRRGFVDVSFTHGLKVRVRVECVRELRPMPERGEVEALLRDTVRTSRSVHDSFKGSSKPSDSRH